MAWRKLGLVYCPDGTLEWAKHSFMTPVPLQIKAGVIRIWGGFRDAAGISRIGWIDVAADDPTHVLEICKQPALDLGDAGMFDDNGVILGDVIPLPDGTLRMYYVGFQLVEKIKFMAFTGLATSCDGGVSFRRLQPTPVLDRAPQAHFINALHSILPMEGGYRAYISCSQRWQDVGGRLFPQYNCWTVFSEDGVRFDMRGAIPTIDVEGQEYRIGRPRTSRLSDGSYEMRVTSDTLSKQYACYRAVSTDGINFFRTSASELPRGVLGEWDSEMTCYPARLDTASGESFLFYNGNNMGETGLGVAVLEKSR